jgi:hypothetical protein
MNRFWGQLATLAVITLLAGSARAGSLDGLVVAKGATREYPLAHTTVELCPAKKGRCRNMTTGRDGRFFVSKIAPGSYKARIFLPGRADYKTKITVNRGRTSFVKIKIRK